MYSSRDFRSRGRHWDSEEDFHVPPSARRPASYHLPAINPMQASRYVFFDLVANIQVSTY